MAIARNMKANNFGVSHALIAALLPRCPTAEAQVGLASSCSTCRWHCTPSGARCRAFRMNRQSCRSFSWSARPVVYRTRPQAQTVT
eukprot:scaffold4768_cov412-Prasinococcus_capsulatus_cf.AAC.29